jgi:hypothetical protein
MGKKMIAYKILQRKPPRKHPRGRPKSRWENNIKMDPREIGVGCDDWR